MLTFFIQLQLKINKMGTKNIHMWLNLNLLCIYNWLFHVILCDIDLLTLRLNTNLKMKKNTLIQTQPCDQDPPMLEKIAAEPQTKSKD